MGSPNTLAGNSDPSLGRGFLGGNILSRMKLRFLGSAGIEAAQRSYEKEQQQKTGELAVKLAIRNNQTH